MPDVVAALLDVHTVTIVHLLAYPPRDVLRCRVERQQLVEIAMVKIAMHLVLYMLEVNHHAFGVKLLGLAIYRHNPIMAMHIATFTLIWKVEMMATGNLHLL